MSTFSGTEAAELFAGYLHTITQESDRGAVLVAAALLDVGLETVLRKQLAPACERDDPFFSGAYAPLRSFSAKIELAFRLGLITRKTKQLLHNFRRLRNDFAHGIDTVTFNDEATKNRLRAMFELQPDLHEAVVGTLKEILRTDPALPVSPAELLGVPRGQRIIVNVFFASNAMALRRVELEVAPIKELF